MTAKYKYKIKQTKQYKKDFKKIIKQGKNTLLLIAIFDTLLQGSELVEVYLDHPLSGIYQGHREVILLRIGY